MIKIQLSPLVKFKVEGVTTSEDGAPEPFTFWLTCERIATSVDVRAFQKGAEALEEGGSLTPLTDALLPKVRGWSGVKSADGQDVPFSEDAFKGLMGMPGVGHLAYYGYIRESGAKAKNS